MILRRLALRSLLLVLPPLRISASQRTLRSLRLLVASTSGCSTKTNNESNPLINSFCKRIKLASWTGVDGKFFAWQGQFQWVQQLSPQVLLVTRIGGQFSTDSLLSLEKFSLGGINSIRGYEENQLVTDSGIFSGIELRIPVTSDPNTLQLNPFIEFGTGWNKDEPDPKNATIASLGLRLLWLIGNARVRLDYGIPLIDIDNEGNSLQGNGLHFSLHYQPF